MYSGVLNFSTDSRRSRTEAMSLNWEVLVRVLMTKLYASGFGSQL